jgi:hypothetical protein
MYVLNLDAYGCCHGMLMDVVMVCSWMLDVIMSLMLISTSIAQFVPPAFCCRFSPSNFSPEWLRKHEATLEATRPTS